MSHHSDQASNPYSSQPNAAGEPSKTGLKPPRLRLLLLYFYSLWGFVVAQPIYSDLFKDGGFFRWYRFQVSDIWIAVFLISFAIPGFWMMCLWQLHRCFSRWVRLFCTLQIGFLLSCFGLLLLQTTELPYLIKLITVTFAGIQATRIILRSRERAFLLYFLVPSAMLFPVVFLLTCPLTTPFLPKIQTGTMHRITTAPAASSPVVLIVFDELPLVSLLDRHEQIDAVNFPNFAALAKNATWFPNAVTVHTITRGAIPAILTGNNPLTNTSWMNMIPGQNQITCKNPLPTTETYPDTLFTLLEKTHQVHAFESRIYLCPDSICKQRPAIAPNAANHSPKQRILFMMKRTTEEYLFKILFNNNEINKLYFDYKVVEKKAAQADLSKHNREHEITPVSHEFDVGLYGNFVNALQPQDKPGSRPDLYFIHPVLPHSPWEYFPSGKKYPASRMVNLSNNVLCESSPSLLSCRNATHSVQQYQRHLLQVQYADKMLGQALDKLKASHLYDRAIIVVTADHGVSFMPQQFRRSLDDDNDGEILPIPLLIKAPNQHASRVDLRQAENIDIVPSIADLLDMPLRWRTDGRSLFLPWVKDRKSHAACASLLKVHFKPSQIEESKQQALQRKLTDFGDLRQTPDEIFNTGTHRPLIGKVLTKAELSNPSLLSVDLSRYFLDDGPGKTTKPALLNGRLYFPADYNSPQQVPALDLAVTVNGKIVAVTQPFNYSLEKQQADLAVLIPENSFRYGKDRLQLVQVVGKNPEFRPIPEFKPEFRIISKPKP